MKRAFLLAYPAGHSLSPAMHNAAFAHLGLAARYEALEVRPEALALVAATLRSDEVLGANVTIPHKEAVIPFLDGVDETAARIGAVNTVVNRGGRLTGYNTDAPGFGRALAEAGLALQGRRALLLGAGGSARAVAYALLRAGVSCLGVYNRSAERAEALAGDFAALGPVHALEAGALEGAVLAADLLINTTAVGMVRASRDPDASPLPPGVLPERGFVCDLVYRPAKTRLLREAEEAGLRTQNGLPMLVYQGAEAFGRWTGREPPVAVMMAAALTALEAAP